MLTFLEYKRFFSIKISKKWIDCQLKNPNYIKTSFESVLMWRKLMQPQLFFLHKNHKFIENHSTWTLFISLLWENTIFLTFSTKKCQNITKFGFLRILKYKHRHFVISHKCDNSSPYFFSSSLLFFFIKYTTAHNYMYMPHKYTKRRNISNHISFNTPSISIFFLFSYKKN